MGHSPLHRLPQLLLEAQQLADVRLKPGQPMAAVQALQCTNAYIDQAGRFLTRSQGLQATIPVLFFSEPQLTLVVLM